MTVGVDETLTFEQAKEALTKAVQERGRDYRYPVLDEDTNTGCVYRWTEWQQGLLGDECKTGDPACGVGLAMHHLGILETVIPPYEEDGMTDFVNNEDAVTDLLLEAEPFAMRLLHLFQLNQDKGLAWGRSLDEALEQVGREMAASS